MGLTADQMDAYEMFVTLQQVYMVGVIIILSCGAVAISRCVYVFFSNFKKLNSVVKSYMSVIIPDIFMVINFLPRDIYHLSAGHLDTGGFCQLSAFVTISAVTALNCGSVCISYATFRLVNGNPMPDKLVLVWNVFSWVFGMCLAAIFFLGDLIGPYKGLYCCVKETQYRAYAVAPIILVTFTAIFLMSYFYYQSYLFIKGAEKGRAAAAGGGASASETVLKRGVLLVSTFYLCWSVIIFVGFSTSVGVKIGAPVDVVGAWISKFMPLIDSVVLLQMLDRIVGKQKKAGAASSAASDAEEGRAKR